MNDGKSNPPPGSIPIRTSFVCAYVYRRAPQGVEFLIMKRTSRHMFGLWQQVAGKIEEGETGAETALREIKEETGINPEALYSGDIVEMFYDTGHNCIHIVPVFVAEFSSASKVVLSSEHSEYRWVSAEEAKKYLVFSQQRNSIDAILNDFIDKEPPPQLRIKP